MYLILAEESVDHKSSESLVWFKRGVLLGLFLSASTKAKLNKDLPFLIKICHVAHGDWSTQATLVSYIGLLT